MTALTVGRPLSAVAVAGKFSARDHDVRDAREQAAVRLITVSFSALAAYVSLDALRMLVTGGKAEHSSAGRELGSASAVADSKQALLCTYLSAVLLVGLELNSLFDWTWTDRFAALVIAVVAVKEGWQAWRGDKGCVPASQAKKTTSR